MNEGPLRPQQSMAMPAHHRRHARHAGPLGCRGRAPLAPQAWIPFPHDPTLSVSTLQSNACLARASKTLQPLAIKVPDRITSNDTSSGKLSKMNPPTRAEQQKRAPAPNDLSAGLVAELPVLSPPRSAAESETTGNNSRVACMMSARGARMSRCPSTLPVAAQIARVESPPVHAP